MPRNLQSYRTRDRARAKHKEIQSDVGPKMPFGKYAGTPINRLPSAYLEWASTNIHDTDLRSLLLDEVTNQMLTAQ